MIRTLFTVALITLGLAGCATPRIARDDVPPGNAYFALGTEPFWALEITPARLTFTRPGAPPLVVANPGERREGDHRLYLGQALAVRIVPQPCSDGMSDRRYADSVVVRIGNGPEHLNGCGGAAMPMTGGSLERSSWRITAIDGRAAIAEVEADIAFADGRVTGTAGCNRLAGSYTQQRNALTIGGIAATRMACPGPRGAQETAVLAVLNLPMTVTWGPRMTMTLTAADGKRIDLRRLDWD